MSLVFSSLASSWWPYWRWQEVPDAILLEQTPKRYFVEWTDRLTTHPVQYRFAFEAGEANDRLKDYVRFGQLPDGLPKEE